MKKSFIFIITAIVITINNTSYSQETFGSFIKLKSLTANVPADTINKYQPIDGFCYYNGNLWGVTYWSYVYQIDTTGVLQNIIKLEYGPDNGAIYIENDTIWVVNDFRLYAHDMSGKKILNPIDFEHLGSPFNSHYINGLIKDGNTFWLSERTMPVLFQINRNGNLLKQYPNSWYDFWSNTITMLDDKIIKKTDSGSFISDDWDYNAVISINKQTGLIEDMWDYPTFFQGADTPVGLSVGDNCYWVITASWSSIQILKLSIPGLSPVPEIENHKWGDFDIVDWGYSPIRPSNIEGLNGLEYDKEKKQFWIGEYGQTLARFQNMEDKIFPIENFYNNYLFVIYDIAVNNDTIWVADYWRGWWPPRVLQLTLINDSLEIVNEWNLGFDQVDGLATNGKFLWASGRTNTISTADYSNEIIKYDFSGNIINQFNYPDSINYHFSDLTWHKNLLWAITDPGPFGDKAIIYAIDENTGVLLESYATEWKAPSNNAGPTLASDENYLYTLGVLPSTNVFATYESDHLRLLKLEINKTQVKDSNDKKPSRFILYNNYPNPFNSNTVIKYNLLSKSNVELIIFNILGEQVRKLFKSDKPAGTYITIWDGKDDFGKQLESGVYFCKMSSSDYTQVIKLIMIK